MFSFSLMQVSVFGVAADAVFDVVNCFLFPSCGRMLRS
jgi:hypothetical protein